MKFNYETQGAITYFVCELEGTEQIDSLTLGMLTNNHIVGLAPVLYTEMNNQRFLKYNISAKISVEQIFGGNMNKERAMLAFHNILSAVCSAEDYMIDPNCFLMQAEYMFMNVSSCETALICIPVVSDKDVNMEAINMFKKLLVSAQFAPNEDAGYIAQLIAYLNDVASFNIYRFKDLVEQVKQQPSMPAVPKVEAVAVTPSVQLVAQQPVQQIPSLDATISIDDMPDLLNKSGALPPVQPVVPPVQPVVPPVQPVVPSVQPVVPPVQPVVPPVQPVVPPVQPVVPPVQPVVPPIQPVVPPIRPVTPPVQPKPPVDIPKKQPVQNPGFAIPGQPNGAESKKTESPKGKKQKVEAKEEDKQMSIFGLLAHYNKENAALYKAQKAAKKSKGTPVQPPTNQKLPQAPPEVAPTFTPPVYTPPQPVIQPVPVQNSFNETTVLSAFPGGETTVLGAMPGVVEPVLTRVKTGERIVINKPVFRIGKERSYVDYFIGDNTAISRSHANVHTDNGEYFIEDTNSTNHTYVNGKIISSNVKVKMVSGDKIRLANEDFIFTL